uniref:Protein quiver n=1 Tax=Megaselia scalaris TaxID=36166 RepID=T1H4J0_MEGSC
MYNVAISSLNLVVTSALHCWQCSSDTLGAEDFCGEVFKKDSIPEDVQRRNYLDVTKHCNSSGIHSEFLIPVCRKTVEENICE